VIGFLLPAGVFVALLLIWLLFRRGGYKRRPLDSPPGRDWNFTGERFVDPKSGEMLDVWFCPRSGERAYVRSQSGRNL
jgi:hypothetical protein